MPACRGSSRRAGLLAAALAAAAALAGAEEAPIPWPCAGGVCGFNLPPARPAPAPCDEHTVLVAYRQGGGAVLVQCSARGPDADDLLLVFDSRQSRAPAFELADARFLKAEALGALPLCGAEAPPAPGTLLLGRKAPRAEQPPCWRVLRLRTQPAGLDVPGGQPAPPERWQSLQAFVRGLLPR